MKKGKGGKSIPHTQVLKIESVDTVNQSSRVYPATLHVSPYRWTEIGSNSWKTWQNSALPYVHHDWQLNTEDLNSPAVTSTHLAPHAAQNKHLEIPADLTHLHQQVWFVYQQQMAGINYFWLIRSNCSLSVGSRSPRIIQIVHLRRVPSFLTEQIKYHLVYIKKVLLLPYTNHIMFKTSTVMFHIWLLIFSSHTTIWFTISLICEEAAVFGTIHNMNIFTEYWRKRDEVFQIKDHLENLNINATFCVKQPHWKID